MFKPLFDSGKLIVKQETKEGLVHIKNITKFSIEHDSGIDELLKCTIAYIDKSKAESHIVKKSGFVVDIQNLRDYLVVIIKLGE